MLRSMTGFGRCLVENTQAVQQWEIRSVNSKYLDVKWRLPYMLRYLEPILEKLVRKIAIRGRIDISLQITFSKENSPKPVFDKSLAFCMLEELEKLAQERGEELRVDYTSLLAIQSLWGEPALEEDQDMDSFLAEGLTIALEDWNESRILEGEELGKDLRNRIARMQQWLEEIEERAPDILQDRIQTLRKRIEDIMCHSSSPFNENLFLQEIVTVADRLDVSEELTRLSAHLDRLLELLAQDSDAGKRIDFTLQECFREINTCGNKINDAQISRLVVEFKNELEKCREQAQNLE